MHVDAILVVYFVYGLAFFAMGLALILGQAGQLAERDVRRAMYALAAFALLHGLHEWYEMFLRLDEVVLGLHPSTAEEILRVVVLVGSFGLLALAGCELLCPEHRLHALLTVLLMVFAAGAVLIVTRYRMTHATLHALDVWARYSLGVTGATLTGVGLMRRARGYHSDNRPAWAGLSVAALALVVYGLVGQTAPPPSVIWPSTVYSSETFRQLFGFPVQILRAAVAAAATAGLLVALRALEQARQRQMRAETEARLAAQAQVRQELARREALQKELLRRTIDAQEAERGRISRELHDHIGQTLTALSYRTAAIEAAYDNPQRDARADLKDVSALVEEALADLRHLVTDLRPAQLDDLGLVAALHWLADQARDRTGLDVMVSVEGRKARLDPAVETALFRIAQESLTNVVRHARVRQAHVALYFEADAVTLTVRDAGRGFVLSAVMDAGAFDDDTAWGLLGMQERAEAVGGSLIVSSRPGEGTVVCVRIPQPGDTGDA